MTNTTNTAAVPTLTAAIPGAVIPPASPRRDVMDRGTMGAEWIASEMTKGQMLTAKIAARNISEAALAGYYATDSAHEKSHVAAIPKDLEILANALGYNITPIEGTEQ